MVKVDCGDSDIGQPDSRRVGKYCLAMADSICLPELNTISFHELVPYDGFTEKNGNQRGLKGVREGIILWQIG
jgi:hypothetical protein